MNADRLSVHVNRETAALLERFKQDGQSLTQTVRLAVGLYAFLWNEEAKGKQILIEDGSSRTQVLLTTRRVP